MYFSFLQIYWTCEKLWILIPTSKFNEQLFDKRKNYIFLFNFKNSHIGILKFYLNTLSLINALKNLQLYKSTLKWTPKLSREIIHCRVKLYQVTDQYNTFEKNLSFVKYFCIYILKWCPINNNVWDKQAVKNVVENLGFFNLQIFKNIFMVLCKRLLINIAKA